MVPGLEPHHTPLIDRPTVGLVSREALLFQSRRFALSFAQVVKPGAAHMGMPEHFDLFDTRRMQRKGTLNPNTVRGNPPYGEVGIGATSPTHAHDCAPHQLDSLPVTLDDSVVDLHIIANAETWKIRFQSDIFLKLLFFNRP
jgi:hypothetical protein